MTPEIVAARAKREIVVLVNPPFHFLVRVKACGDDLAFRKRFPYPEELTALLDNEFGCLVYLEKRVWSCDEDWLGGKEEICNASLAIQWPSKEAPPSDPEFFVHKDAPRFDVGEVESFAARFPNDNSGSLVVQRLSEYLT